jgi:methionyl aminopeptidase
MSITIHQPQDFIKMRVAGKIAAEVLDYIAPFVQVGVSTNQLNDLCHKKIISAGAIPAPLNYKGFPKSICTSINHVVCHGIPNDKLLKNGDIINIDVTVIVDGWHGDTSKMFFVGKPSIKAKKLVQTTYECLMLGIEQVKPGADFNEIGKAIQKHAHNNGFSVVRDFCGHGIGKIFHAEPNVLHYVNKPYGTMQTGMFFTIEPMINEGSFETLINSQDGWTVWTRDKKLSAQFEHTVAVTETGYEIFT